MIYKYTTCEPIIAKIMADNDVENVGQRVTDFRDWIFEAIDKIGAPQQFDHKESNTEDTPLLRIKDYQAKLPDDLVSLETVAYSHNEDGPWLNMRYSTGSFNLKPDKGDPPLSTEPDKPSMEDDNAIYPILVINQFNPNITNYSVDPQYFLKPGYLVTNKREGYLKISYKAILTDKRGYPLVPDLASYQEALYWYVQMKLSWPKYYDGSLRSEVYFMIKNSWNYYRKQAYGEAMMPNEGQMESIKNEWLKLVPEINNEQNFGSTIGQQQRMYSNYYGRLY